MAADEILGLVDDAGHEVGSAPRWQVRRDNLRHRATAVLVRNRRGEIYVHRRTDDKDVYPGAHDVWAGGCVLAGEDVAEAAARELAEELGISGVPLTPVDVFDYADDTTRYQASCYEVTWDRAVVHQPEEVAWGGWRSVTWLREHLADPTWPFVPDGRVGLERWFARAGDQTDRIPTELRSSGAGDAGGSPTDTTGPTAARAG